MQTAKYLLLSFRLDGFFACIEFVEINGVHARQTFHGPLHHIMKCAAVSQGLSFSTRSSFTGRFLGLTVSKSAPFQKTYFPPVLLVDHFWHTRTAISGHAILAGVIGLALGTRHTILVKQDGSVWSTDVTADRQSKGFVQVISSGTTAVAAGDGYSIVLKQDGSVWTIVQSSKGQFSFSDKSAISGPANAGVMIPGAKAVAAGRYHSMVLTQGGVVWVTGKKVYGQPQPIDVSTSHQTGFSVIMSSGAKAVTTGDAHSVVLKQDGSVWAMGRNDNGQLGDGSRTDQGAFVKVMPSGAAAVAAGGYHSIVLKQDGSLWATGWNEFGQLGDGSIIDKLEYTQAVSYAQPGDGSTTEEAISQIQVVSSGVKAIAGGSRHSMMLKQDGSVWATGYNSYGQLGDGTTTNSAIFMPVITDGVRDVTAGAFHSMVLKEDGSVWATGLNQDGQFGDGSVTSCKNFIRLAPLFRYGAGHDHIHMVHFR